MKEHGLVDEVIKEPLNGAHRDQENMFSIVKDKVKQYIKELEAIKPGDRVEQRIEKFNKMGVWK